MPRKTIIIFITVFILVGALFLGFSYYKNKSTTDTQPSSPDTGYNSFNPFGQSTPPLSEPTTGEDPNVGNAPVSPDEETAPELTTARFHKITDFAVAGAVYFEDMRPLPQAEEVTAASGTVAIQKKTTKPAQPKFEIVPSLRYVEKVTGHIDEMYLDTKTAGKISNSTIPAIYEAMFDGKASTIIYRYLAEDGATIQSFIATLGATKGEFLPANITDISLSPDKSKFFYLARAGNNTIGTVRAFGETRSTQVFTSPFDEWLSQWVGNQKIYLTTKASADAEGTLFSLNTATGTLTKIFGGVVGLTTLSNADGSLVLYSSSTGGGPKLGVFSLAKHTTLDLNLYGLPEKCVWSKDGLIAYCAIPNNISGGQYPDSWYQGATSFDDRFVKINTATGETNAIADSADGISVDATHLFLNKDESEMFFTNKKDSTLWSLDLK